MPIFRRRHPLRRVRIAWALAGCFMAVARGDWPLAAARVASVLRLLRKEIARARGEASGEDAGRVEGPNREGFGQEGN